MSLCYKLFHIIQSAEQKDCQIELTFCQVGRVSIELTQGNKHSGILVQMFGICVRTFSGRSNDSQPGLTLHKMVDCFMSQTPNAVHPHITTKHHVNNAILTTPNPSHHPPNKPISTNSNHRININNQTKYHHDTNEKHHSTNNNSPIKTHHKTTKFPLVPPPCIIPKHPIFTHHHHTKIRH